MANFTAGTSFSDGVTNDVTAAKLNALVADAVPTSNLSLNSTTGTIANFTASTANITLGTIPTLTAGTTTGTAGVFTSGTITTGLIPTLTAGTTTGTAGVFTSGTITTGLIPTLTAGTTTGTAGIFTSGTITTLNSTTPTFLGAITASTNTINVGSGQIYKDASGLVGIGGLPTTKLNVVGTSADYITAQIAVGEASNATGKQLQLGYNTTADKGYVQSVHWGTGYTDLAINPNGGNVGVGTASPIYPLDVYNSSNGGKSIGIQNPNTGTGAFAGVDANSDAVGICARAYGSTFNTFTHAGIALAGAAEIWADTFSGSGPQALLIGIKTAKPLILATNDTERLRIDSSGNVLVGTTSTDFSSGVGFKFLASATMPKLGIVINSSGADSQYNFYNTNATNNGYRFYVNNNGGISNFSANNVNLSDERLKTNINLCGNYLDKICSIPVKTFNYKDQGEDTEKTIGVLAQEVEAVIPELINNDGFGETPSDGIPLKTIYQTDLQYVLMRCIQELSAKVTALESA
jgi:hypothetical protein